MLQKRRKTNPSPDAAGAQHGEGDLLPAVGPEEEKALLRGRYRDHHPVQSQFQHQRLTWLNTHQHRPASEEGRLSQQ